MSAASLCRPHKAQCVAHGRWKTGAAVVVVGLVAAERLSSSNFEKKKEKKADREQQRVEKGRGGRVVSQREPSVSSQNRRPAPQTDFALFNGATFPSISVIACDRQMSAWPLSSFLFQGNLL